MVNDGAASSRDGAAGAVDVRTPASVGIAAATFVVGIPTALSLDYLTLYDAVAKPA